MSNTLVIVLCAVAALGSALVGGFFFAFSAVTMKALGRLPAAHGVAAMQSINVVVLNAWFFSTFFGTAALCMVLAAYFLFSWQAPASVYVLLASALYLVGVIVVTMVFSVPLNQALAARDPASAEADGLWRRYLRVWTAWNHVRTVAPLLAAAAFVMALRYAPL